jgi:3-hydroxymyristoyl/3-hydroxydecanoyl-(acyl carrier protein) dehydratase
MTKNIFFKYGFLMAKYHLLEENNRGNTEKKIKRKNWTFFGYFVVEFKFLRR